MLEFKMKMLRLHLILWLCLGVFCSTNGLTQTPSPTQERPATLGLERGFVEFDTPDFKIKLVKASQTQAELEPKGASGSDFTSADRPAAYRAADKIAKQGRSSAVGRL